MNPIRLFCIILLMTAPLVAADLVPRGDEAHDRCLREMRAYGQVYAAQGNETAPLAKFREALQLEANP